MEKYDAIFLGNGPTAASCFHHYFKKSNGKGNYLLLMENADPDGAIVKGVKSVNLIVPKLPFVKSNQFDNYQSVVNTLRASSSVLQRIYERTAAFTSKCETGFRYCRDTEELEVLKTLKGAHFKVDDTLTMSASKFISESLGHQIDKEKLFSYEERIWNVDAYQDIMRSNIPKANQRLAQRVRVEQGDKQIILDIEDLKGDHSKVATDKLFVCKGIGNISFEDEIKATLSLSEPKFSFSVLSFSKFFYNGERQMPPSVSSIMLPAQGVCVTNERPDLHSILFDTNSGWKPANGFNVNSLNDNISVIREKLISQNPSLTESCVKEYNCAMTVDPDAYWQDPMKHFMFVISRSVMENIHYLNLPYFTVIGTAVQNLPVKIIDFK